MKPPYRTETIAVDERGEDEGGGEGVRKVRREDEGGKGEEDARAPSAAPLAPPQKSAEMVVSGERRGPTARLPSGPRVALPCGTGTSLQTAKMTNEKSCERHQVSARRQRHRRRTGEGERDRERTRYRPRLTVTIMAIASPEMRSNEPA